MRQAHGALAKLSRLQAERRKLEQDDEDHARATETQQRVIALMAQAIAEQPMETDADLLEQLEPAHEADLAPSPRTAESDHPPRKISADPPAGSDAPSPILPGN